MTSLLCATVSQLKHNEGAIRHLKEVTKKEIMLSYSITGFLVPIYKECLSSAISGSIHGCTYCSVAMPVQLALKLRHRVGAGFDYAYYYC